MAITSFKIDSLVWFTLWQHQQCLFLLKLAGGNQSNNADRVFVLKNLTSNADWIFVSKIYQLNIKDI